jgi:predicted DNA binding CopG/RHH family protein
MKKKKSIEPQKPAAVREERIDTSDIPDLAGTTGWKRGLMYRPVLQPISIRLPAPDIAAAQKLARKKGIPYQTYIKMLLHDALKRELGASSPSRGNRI